MTDGRASEEPTSYVSIDQELRARIANEQALADLPGRGVATLQAIHRRRHQIAFVAGLVAVAVIVATLVSEKVIDIGADSWIDADVARYALAAFAFGIVLYAFDKDRHLRRVVAQRERIYELDCEIAGSLPTVTLRAPAARRSDSAAASRARPSPCPRAAGSTARNRTKPWSPAVTVATTPVSGSPRTIAGWSGASSAARSSDSVGGSTSDRVASAARAGIGTSPSTRVSTGGNVGDGHARRDQAGSPRVSIALHDSTFPARGADHLR